MIRRCLPALVSVVLTGCVGWSSISAERVPLPAVAPEWVQADTDGDAGDAVGWLAGFKDPLLDSLVAEAVAGNPALAGARARLAEGEAGAVAAGAARLPGVDFNFQKSRSRANGLTGAVISERFTTNLTLNWEVDVWQRIGASAQAAELDRDALAMDLHAARLSLAASVARAWFDVVEGRAQVALAEQLVSNLSAHLGSLERGYRSGLNSAADVQLARSNLSSEQSRAIERQRVLGDRQRTLEILLGRYPAAQIAGAREKLSLPALPPAVPVGVPSSLLERRADIAAAQRRLLGAELRQTSAHADRFPKFGLTASAGNSSAELADLLKGSSAVWSLLGNLVQPLIDGGRREAVETQAAARVTQAEARYVEVVLQAFSEVEGALEQERRVRAQLVELNQSLIAAERVEALTVEEYESGIANTLAMLEVKRRTFAARSSLLDARWRQLRNRINLTLALGGDYAAPAGGDQTTKR
ncbi:MAG: efflux transporter outer membrane subunit [Sulfuritalea sp.]|nr:efflux transporter outer membrane subunit [Sulfuritalea sp.]